MAPPAKESNRTMKVLRVVCLSLVITLLAFYAQGAKPGEAQEAVRPSFATSKRLNPRPLPKAANLDVIIIVDGSTSISVENFQKEKQLCLALAARIDPNSQVGVIQFSDQAKLESSLSTSKSILEKSLDGMKQLGGQTNLHSALSRAKVEFELSRYPSNRKHIWVITDGDYQDPADPNTNTALIAQELRRENKATIYTIGVGPGVSLMSLNRVASAGCAFLVDDFNSAFKILEKQIQPNDLSCQITADILFPRYPYKLGDDVFLSIQVENVGLSDLASRSSIIFHENQYFKKKTVFLYDSLLRGMETSVEVKLVPKIKEDRNLESQILALPEVLEFTFLDAQNNEISCDSSGFLLRAEHFAGDIYEYHPILTEEAIANILTFGPPGAGKSSFVDSVLTALNDAILNLNIVGGATQVVTAKLEQFPLARIPGFEGIKFAMYDVPGIDGKNYQGDEISLLLHGVMPPGIEFKDTPVFARGVQGRRSSLKDEWERRVHVVAFFVPQGSVSDTNTMVRLQYVYRQITNDFKCKAIIVVSHADEISGELEKEEISKRVCEKMSVSNSSVYFLENYVNTKEKVFHLDKNILRIVLAMLRRADDFMIYERVNPRYQPYGAQNS